MSTFINFQLLGYDYVIAYFVCSFKSSSCVFPLPTSATSWQQVCQSAACRFCTDRSVGGVDRHWHRQCACAVVRIAECRLATPETQSHITCSGGCAAQYHAPRAAAVVITAIGGTVTLAKCGYRRGAQPCVWVHATLGAYMAV
jgi:hypothetical protein